MSRPQDGSAVVESIFGILLVLVLVLGTIQVALFLYARNVVMAAVHDGARAAVEIGTLEGDAAAIADDVVRRSAGSLVDGLRVRSQGRVAGDRYTVRVVASGSLDVPGPVPIAIPITAVATGTREMFDV